MFQYWLIDLLSADTDKLKKKFNQYYTYKLCIPKDILVMFSSKIIH